MHNPLQRVRLKLMAWRFLVHRFTDVLPDVGGFMDNHAADFGIQLPQIADNDQRKRFAGFAVTKMMRNRKLLFRVKLQWWQFMLFAKRLDTFRADKKTVTNMLKTGLMQPVFIFPRRAFLARNTLTATARATTTAASAYSTKPLIRASTPHPPAEIADDTSQHHKP